MEETCGEIYMNPLRHNFSPVYNSRNETPTTTHFYSLNRSSSTPPPVLPKSNIYSAHDDEHKHNFADCFENDMPANGKYTKNGACDNSLVVICNGTTRQSTDWDFDDDEDDNVDDYDDYPRNAYHDVNYNNISPPLKNPANRRFSFIGSMNSECSIETIDRKNLSHHYSAQFEKNQRRKLDLGHHKMSITSADGLPPTGHLKSAMSTMNLSDGKSTLSRKALKFAQKAQKLSIATISSELSNSASALYSLFSESNNSDNCSQRLPSSHANYNNNNDINCPNYNDYISFFLDQTETVSHHTQRGIDFLDKFGQFVKERTAIEEEYASKLKNLVKKNRSKKTDDEEGKGYSYVHAFSRMLGELESLANQHEVIAEQLRRDVFNKLGEKTTQLAAARKKHCAIFKHLNVHVEEAAENMRKAQKLYIKAFRETEAAHIKNDKTEKNMELSRLEVERAKNNVIQKSQICEKAKQNYGHALEEANRVQHEHLTMKLPALLEEMRNLDVERIDYTKQAMLNSISAETRVTNIIQTCHSEMVKAISSIDPEKDTALVVVQHKTGYAFPQEHVFEDLGSPSAILSANGESDASSTLKRNVISGSATKLTNGKSVARKHSMHQRLFGVTSNSKGHACGTRADGYANLPPQQRCRKIEAKLDELGRELEKLRQARVGLEKMFEVFQGNPKMGKANDVAQQLQKNHTELESVGEKIERFRTLLITAQSELNTPLGGDHHAAHQQQVVKAGNGVSNSASPRVNSSNASLSTTGVNNHRSSYTDDSSVSSADGSAFARSSLNSSAVGNASLASNGFQSKTNAATSAMSTMSLTSNNTNNGNIQHIDEASADFYEECDNGSLAPSTAAAMPTAATNANGHSNTASITDDGPSVLGTCTALYAFEGSSDGTTIAMREGDEMLLLERDEGDGWTRVRLINAPPSGDLPVEGFVPTTYLECRWYPSQ